MAEIPFEIRLSSKIDANIIDQIIAAVDIAATRIANEVGLKLAVIADSNLHTTKDRYINAISVQGQGLNSKVLLDESEWIIARIEKGFQGFDMKPGLLGGHKAKTSKNGIRYNIIPITKNGTTVFRMVSDRSPANSWIHPGIAGRPLVEMVIDQYKKENLIDKIMNEEIQKVFNK